MIAVSVFDTPKFKKLHAQWEKKLASQGIPDIEDRQGRLKDNKDLIQLSRRTGFKTDVYISVRDYFIWVDHSLNWAQFESRTDEMIWILHGRGKSSHEIADEVCLDQTWVARKIKRIRTYVATQEPDSSKS